MNSNQPLKGKVAIVTGSAQGIGRAIALRFSKEGASVVVTDIQDKGREVEKEIHSQGGKALFFKMDVAKKEDVLEMVSKAKEVFGPIDILVNNAGISKRKTVVELPEDLWDRIIATNLKGTFLCSQAVLPGMIERKYGKVVNIASRAGETGRAMASAYAASKSGILGFTRTLALEVASYQINVNAIIPGPTDTPMWRSVHSEELIKKKLALNPMITGVKKPEAIGDLALFLVTDASILMTGQVLILGHHGG
jgi:3-oxoacyl-[acyl-carrier protein] reductase